MGVAKGVLPPWYLLQLDRRGFKGVPVKLCGGLRGLQTPFPLELELSKNYLKTI